jgi:hypothetical protein
MHCKIKIWSDGTSGSYAFMSVYPAVALADPPETLPTPWNAGSIDMAWITEDFTMSEVQQRQRTVVPDIEKVPLQGPARRSSVPAGSV